MMLPTKRVSGCPRVIHAWHGRSTHRTASPWIRSVSSDSANGTSMDEDILKTQAAVMKEDATRKGGRGVGTAASPHGLPFVFHSGCRPMASISLGTRGDGMRCRSSGQAFFLLVERAGDPLPADARHDKDV